MNDYRNRRAVAVTRTSDKEELKQYTLWVLGSFPLLAIAAISYLMHPAFQ